MSAALARMNAALDAMSGLQLDPSDPLDVADLLLFEHALEAALLMVRGHRAPSVGKKLKACRAALRQRAEKAETFSWGPQHGGRWSYEKKGGAA